MSESELRCGQCLFIVPAGAHVCQACGARQVYGPLPEEIDAAAKGGLVYGATATMVFLYGVPYLANVAFGFSIPSGFGLEMMESLVAAFSIGAIAAAHQLKACEERLEGKVRSIRISR